MNFLSKETLIEPDWPISPLVFFAVAAVVFSVSMFSYRAQLHLSGFNTNRWRWLQAISLATLRTGSCLLVLWMLAGWMLQPFATEHPELHLLVDVSSSMGTLENNKPESPSAGTSRLQKVQSRLAEGTLQKLEEKFHVRAFSIGDQLKEIERNDGLFEASLRKLENNQTHSRLGSAIRDSIGLSRGQSVAAIVMFTDGINTDGISLADASLIAKERKMPLYFLGIGQPQQSPDLRIRDVLSDPVVFLGDSVSMQVLVERRDLAQVQSVVRLVDPLRQEVLQEQKLVFGKEETEHWVQMEWKADRAGRRNLVIEVPVEQKELDTSNNRVERSIEVRDTAIPVLLIGGAPGYEFRFLKHLLERTRQTGAPDQPAFDVKTVLEQADPDYVLQDATSLPALPAGEGSLQKYDVVILGDASPSLLNRSFMQSLNQFVSIDGGGLMVLAGPEFMPHRFRDTELGKLLPIELSKLEEPTMEPAMEVAPFRWKLNEEISLPLPLRLDGASEVNRKRWEILPVQSWRHKGVVPKSVAQVLARSDDGSSNHEPLLVAQFVGAGRVAFQATDETFQWQSHFGDDIYYQRYWTQMVRWLSRNRSLQKQDAELELDANRYRTGSIQTVTLQLSVPMARNPVLRITQGNKQIQTVAMEKHPDFPSAYRANLSNLSPGSYKIEWVSDDDTLKAMKEFTIDPVPGELASLDPDIVAMKEAAKATKGRYLSWNEMNDLEKYLPNTGLIRLQPLAKIPFWNHWIFTALLVLLLATEWSVRRVLGLI